MKKISIILFFAFFVSIMTSFSKEGQSAKSFSCALRINNPDTTAKSIIAPKTSNMRGKSPIDEDIKNAHFYLPSGVKIDVKQFNDSVKTARFFYDIYINQPKLSFHLKYKPETIFNLLNKPFPATELIDLNGAEIKIKDGVARYSYINFWSLSCKPCLEELSIIDSLSLQFLNTNFIAVSPDKDEVIRKYISKRHTQLRYLQNGSDLVNKLYVDYYPIHMIIDQNNNIIYISAGLLDDKNKKKLIDIFSN